MPTWDAQSVGCLLVTDRAQGPVELWLRSHEIPVQVIRSPGAAFCLTANQVGGACGMFIELSSPQEALASVPLLLRSRALAQLPLLVVLPSANPELAQQIRNLGAFCCMPQPVADSSMQHSLHAAAIWRRGLDAHKRSNTEDQLHLLGGTLADSSFSFSTPAQASALAEVLASACPESGRRTLGIQELLLNGIEHGNLGVSGEEKGKLLEAGTWQQDVARLLQLPEHATKRVSVDYKRDAHEITLRVKDEGRGFDWRSAVTKNLEDATGPNGRGIALARLLSFDELRYNEAGNEAIATIFLHHVRQRPGKPKEQSGGRPVVELAKMPTALSPMEWVGLWMDIDQAINVATSDNFYVTVLDLVQQRMHSPHGFFGFIDEQGSFVAPALSDVWGAGQVSDKRFVFRPDQWAGVWGDVLRRGEVLIKNAPHRTPPGHLPIHTSIGAPVIFRGALIGMIYVANRAGGYEARDKELMGLIAQRVAPALAAHIAQERQEEQLHEAQALADKAAEDARFVAQTHDFMVVVGEHVQRANPAFRDTFGWTDEDFRSTPALEMVHPDDRELMRSDMIATLAAPGVARPPLILRVGTKAGQWRTVEWAGIGTEDGTVLAVGRDVSTINVALQVASKENEELSRLHAMLQHEQELAGQVLTNIRSRGCLNAAWFRYISSPLSFFNGDIVLADQTPDGELRWVLGDFTGHGLSAAIGTTPVASAFYATTRKSVPLREVVATLNDLLRSLLPSGLFCAAAVLSLNAERTELTVWNGGLPAVLVRRASEQTLRRVVSQGLPLGLVPSGEMDIEAETLSVDAEDEVYAYSDGLSESANTDGKQFGTRRIEETLRRAGTYDGFEVLLAEVNQHRAGTRAADDVSLVRLHVGSVPFGVTSGVPLKATGT